MFIIAIVLVAVIAIFWVGAVKHSYWKRRGVKQNRQFYFIGDQLGTFLQRFSFASLLQHNYEKYPNERYCGLYQFTRPLLLVRDPDLVKQIAVKDFDHFVDHMNFVPDEPMWSRNLFALKGQSWRDMRSTLSPAFTTSKMRAMFVLIDECAQSFTKGLRQSVDGTTTLDIRDIFTRFANDVIATCAFGVKCDSLKDRQNEFYRMGKEATNFSGTLKMLKLTIYMLAPKLCKLFGIHFFSKRVDAFFNKLVMDTVKMREEQNIVRPDMIHLLMEARKGRLEHLQDQASLKETGFATVEESEVGIKAKSIKQEITNEDMTAQALIFFFAGFDSISIMLCYLVHELAENPDIQDRLYKEIKEHLEKTSGKCTYELLAKMDYLDMVVSETLRKWPVSVMTDRVCVKPYVIPAQEPEELDVNINIGNIIWFPIYPIHRDPQYYPNPTVFDPERFSGDNLDKIKPYTYIPFGAGPRNCIGSRFALMEAKTIVCHMLTNFEMVVVEKTRIPIVISKKSISPLPEGGFWLGLKKRNAADEDVANV